MTIKIKKNSSGSESTQNASCGLIMPISAMGDCTAQHWKDVKEIIEDAVSSIDDPKFDVDLVSNAIDTSVIHKRIVENVYLSNIVVCDISCKNPNVMFELGLRIAFDKSVVVVKDDKTDHAFDTGTIESIEYPRSLRFAEVVAFKKQLTDKIVNTYRASQKANYTSILRSFGAFEVAKVEEEEVSAEALAIRDIQRNLADLMTLLGEERRARIKANFQLEKPVKTAFLSNWESGQPIARTLIEHPLIPLTAQLGLGDESDDRSNK